MFSGIAEQDWNNKISLAENASIPSGAVDGNQLGWDGIATWVPGLPTATTTGEMIYWDATVLPDGAWVTLSIGDEDDVLTVDANDKPSWAASAGGVPSGSNDGDMLIWDTGAWAVLGRSTPGHYVLFGDGSSTSWQVSARCDVGAIGEMLTWNTTSSTWDTITAASNAGQILQSYTAAAPDWAGGNPDDGDMLYFSSGSWIPVEVETYDLSYGSGETAHLIASISAFP